MTSLFKPGAADAILARLTRLTPEKKPHWGRMSAQQMVVHTGHQLKVAFGTLTVQRISGPFRFKPFWWLVIHALPWPKSAPTAPELVSPPVGDWNRDTQELRELIADFASRGANGEWHPHPMFGSIAGKHWGVLAWRHLDHHFRQFGI